MKVIKIIENAKYIVPLSIMLFALGVLGFVEFLALNDYLKSDTSLPIEHHSEIWGIIHGLRFIMYPVIFSVLFSCILIIIGLKQKRNMLFSYAIGTLFFMLCLFIYFQFHIIPDLTFSIEKNPEYFSRNANIKDAIYLIAYPIMSLFAFSSLYFIFKMYK